MIKRVGVLAHPTRSQTAPVAEEISAFLRGRGLSVWCFTEWQAKDVQPHLPETDIVIAIGGDGAMLRCIRVCAPFDIPVLGLNMGYLGFLTEIKGPDNWIIDVEKVLAGECWVESRMMLRAQVWRDDQRIAETHALNDLVVGRGMTTRTIRLDTYIDYEWTTTYIADALVIATPTGSTAYALASGGPILPPQLRNILIVPVAPHLSLDRPIVLEEGAQVDVVVAQDTSASTVLTSDGEMVCDLLTEDRVHIDASKHVGRFVRLRDRNYFYRSLLDRLEPRIPVPREPLRRQMHNPPTHGQGES